MLQHTSKYNQFNIFTVDVPLETTNTNSTLENLSSTVYSSVLAFGASTIEQNTQKSINNNYYKQYHKKNGKRSNTRDHICCPGL